MTSVTGHYEREGDAWTTLIGSCRKLRISPDHVVGSLESAGFRARHDTGARHGARRRRARPRG
jgi:hypothetical protein